MIEDLLLIAETLEQVVFRLRDATLRMQAKSQHSVHLYSDSMKRQSLPKLVAWIDELEKATL